MVYDLAFWAVFAVLAYGLVQMTDLNLSRYLPLVLNDYFSGDYAQNKTKDRAAYRHTQITAIICAGIILISTTLTLMTPADIVSQYRQKEEGQTKTEDLTANYLTTLQQTAQKMDADVQRKQTEVDEINAAESRLIDPSDRGPFRCKDGAAILKR